MPKTIRYFFKNPPLQSRALTVRGLGIREAMRPCLVNRPAGTGDYLIMFFYDEAIIRSKTETARRAPDSLIVWTPSSGHYYGNPDKAWNHSWTHCNGAVIAALLKREQIPLDTVIPNMNARVIEKYLMDLHLELTENNPPEAGIAQNIFGNFFKEIRRLIRPPAQRLAIPGRLLETRWHMETNFNAKLTLRDLARQAGYSTPHFCAAFKRCFGLPPIEYVIRLRMQHAAYFLGDYNLRVREVAEKTGYPDLFYFSRLFKQRYGVSPLAYRKRIPGRTRNAP